LPYIEGFPGYAVSIALISKYGVPVLGVVYLPFSGELITSFDNSYQVKEGNSLYLFCDRSFLESPYFEFVVKDLKEYAVLNQLNNVELYSRAGAVVNSIGVLQHRNAVYFKFPKNKEGGGSLWDYSATECIFRNAGRHVSDVYGQPLDLNRKDSTFMNHKGILYASNANLAQFIISMYQKIGAVN
jgi:3'-phosphoadenosine 5'-phosphosulfate (PAPS) 3'-phosphatase